MNLRALYSTSEDKFPLPPEIKATLRPVWLS